MTAEAVIQRSRQAVLAVFPGASEESFKKILCPIDHSATSRRGLKNAIRLAQALGSELTVLTVVPDVSWLSAAVEAGDFAIGGEQSGHIIYRHLATTGDGLLAGLRLAALARILVV